MHDGERPGSASRSPFAPGSSVAAPSPPWRSAAFWAVLLLALGLRITWALVVTHPELRQGAFAFTAPDEPTFHDVAATLATTGRYAQQPGGPPTTGRTPGYVLPMAALYWLFGPRPVLGLVLNLLFGVALVAAAGCLAGEFWADQRAVWAALVLAAVAPSLVRYSAYALSDSLATWSALAGLVALARWYRLRRASSLAAAGLWWGWAWLTRPSSGLLLAGLMLWVIWQRPRAQAVRGAALCLGVSALCVGPWALRNYLVLGAFDPGSTATGISLWQCNNPVTAGLQPPVDVRGGPAGNLPLGYFRGAPTPRAYTPGAREIFSPSLTERERDLRAKACFRRFVREQPGALLRCVLYKLQSFVLAAEPSRQAYISHGDADGYEVAVRVAAPAGSLRQRLGAALWKGERWLALLCGALGLGVLFRRSRPRGWLALGTVLGTIAFMLVSVPLSRYFMSGTAVLLVAASGLVGASGPRPRPDEGAAQAAEEVRAEAHV